MDDKADVGFVYTHAESVRRCDDTNLAAYEPTLDILLGLWRQTGMEELCGNALRAQELGQFLRIPACRAVDDGASQNIFRKVCLDNLDYTRELLGWCRLQYGEIEVVAPTSAIVVRQLDI